MAKTETVNYIKVTQVKSAIGRIEPQKRTIKALGLGKISSSSVVPDNPAVRGMVASVAHLVKVETAEKSERKVKANKTVKAVAQKPAKVKAKVVKEPAAKKPMAKKPATAKVAVAEKPAQKKTAPKKLAPKKETK